jgi:hypothetical protein
MKHSPQDHIEFMKRPLDWPAWPMLPLIKRQEGANGAFNRRLGVAIEDIQNPGCLLVAYDISVYQIGPGVKWEHITPEELVSNGWEID